MTVTYDDLAQGFSYDPASQVQQILHKLGASGPTINQAAYTYNGVGNRDSLTDRRGTQNFGYDNLDRLTSASHPLLGTPQAFAYDAVGNRTTAGNVTNAGNQLTADATHSYQYDDNGNLTRKTLLATGNYTHYTYDAENRLIKVEDFVAGNPTAAFTSTYRYDGLGRRIEKVANGQTRRYVYDNEDILLEYDDTNTLLARYTHGPGFDEPIAVTKGSATYFYHQDGLGSVTDLTDSTGTTVKSYSYDAYGNILESPGTVEQPYAYTGREFDAESGLFYYRARYYDSAIGRFLTEDPIVATGSLSLFAYVDNDPVNWIDQTGRVKVKSPGGKGGNQGPSKASDPNEIKAIDPKDLKSGTISEPPRPNVKQPPKTPSVFCDLRFAQCLKGCKDCPIPPSPDPRMGKATQVLRSLYKGGCIAYCGTEFAICRVLAALKGRIE